MKNKPDASDSSLSQTMAARIEIEEMGDPAHQKKITDAVEALDGVIETKIAKGALHVSYDPLATSEKKIEQAIRSTGSTIKAAATDTKGPHPDLPPPNVTASSRPKCGTRRAVLSERTAAILLLIETRGRAILATTVLTVANSVSGACAIYVV